MISRTELLTSSIALIEWLTSSAGTSSTVHRLAALLLGGAQANGILDALHVCSVQCYGSCLFASELNRLPKCYRNEEVSGRV